MQRPSRPPRRRLVAAAVAVAAAGVLTVWALLGGGLPGGATGAVPAATDTPGAASPAPTGTEPTGTEPTGTEPTAAAGATPDRTAPPTIAPSGTPGAPPTTPPGIDLSAYSTTDPASLWVVVNKQHPIAPLDYEPSDLVTVDGARVRQVVQADLEAMLAAADAEGVSLGLRTGYRSYGAQAAIRADVEARRGFDHAEKYSARPGYSEHQTGLAFDLHGTSQPGCDLQTCFADTAEGRWVAAYAAQYGFLVRYTPENTAVTGYSPEAWHLRYVGRDLAGWMAAQGIGSLEEALGVTGGPDYAEQ